MGSNESANFMPGALRRTWRYAGAPTDGVAGTYAGIVEKGDLLIDSTNANLYQNTNTQASPTWTQISAGAVTYGVAGEMAAAGTATANAAGATAKSARIDHVHALGAHDHSAADKGGAVVLAALGAGIFTADATGRGKFAAGFLGTDATSRALFATGFFNAATVLDKFAADSFDATACEAVIADSAIPQDKVNWTAGVTPTAETPDVAGAEGTSSSVARADHVHAATCAAPTGYTLAAADAEGTAATFARSNHVHKAILANNVYFVARNAADSADINAWKINAANLLEFGASLAGATMAGTLALADQSFTVTTGDITFSGAGKIDLGAAACIEAGVNHSALVGLIKVTNGMVIIGARNAANNADLAVMTVNASDLIEFGIGLDAFSLGGTVTGSDKAITFTTGYVQFNTGANPAASGALRYANNTVIGAARNAANNADISLWKVNADDDYEAAADVNLGGNKLYGGAADNADLELIATTSATVTTSYIKPAQMVDATTNSIAIRVKAGAIGDGETAQTDLDGELGIDSANGRLYFRYGAAWHYAAQDAGFQVNAAEKDCPVCHEPILVGQAVGGRIDKLMSDGAPHGLWCHLACLN